MIQITIDAALGSKLHDLGQEAQFVDEGGRVVGYFNPTKARAGADVHEPKIGEDEISRRLLQGGGRSLAEIMADLERRQ